MPRRSNGRREAVRWARAATTNASASRSSASAESERRVLSPSPRSAATATSSRARVESTSIVPSLDKSGNPPVSSSPVIAAPRTRVRAVSWASCAVFLSDGASGWEAKRSHKCSGTVCEASARSQLGSSSTKSGRASARVESAYSLGAPRAEISRRSAAEAGSSASARWATRPRVSNGSGITVTSGRCPRTSRAAQSRYAVTSRRTSTTARGGKRSSASSVNTSTLRAALRSTRWVASSLAMAKIANENAITNTPTPREKGRRLRSSASSRLCNATAPSTEKLAIATARSGSSGSTASAVPRCAGTIKSGTTSSKSGSPIVRSDGRSTTSAAPTVPVSSGNTPTSFIHDASARTRSDSTSSGARPPNDRPRPTSTQSEGASGRSRNPAIATASAPPNPAARGINAGAAIWLRSFCRVSTAWAATASATAPAAGGLSASNTPKRAPNWTRVVVSNAASSSVISSKPSAAARASVLPPATVASACSVGDNVTVSEATSDKTSATSGVAPPVVVSRRTRRTSNAPHTPTNMAETNAPRK